MKHIPYAIRLFTTPYLTFLLLFIQQQLLLPLTTREDTPLLLFTLISGFSKFFIFAFTLLLLFSCLREAKAHLTKPSVRIVLIVNTLCMLTIYFISQTGLPGFLTVYFSLYGFGFTAFYTVLTIVACVKNSNRLF